MVGGSAATEAAGHMAEEEEEGLLSMFLAFSLLGFKICLLERESYVSFGEMRTTLLGEGTEL